jgi:TolA-binding protein
MAEGASLFRPTAFALVFLAAAGPACAQMDSREGIALQNQILDLRAQLQQLQQSQGQGAAPGGYPSSLPQLPPDQNSPYSAPAPGGPVNSDTAAQLVVRVGNLEDQVRELQGKVDDLTNQLQRQNDALTKQIGDLQFKLGQGGAPAGGNPPGDQLTPDAPEAAPRLAPPEKPAAAPPPPHRTAENALHEGNAALARRDYAAAAAAAREVLASHGVRSTDAQFLLARAETGEHKYREAAADYYLAYNREPKASGAPVALLGVANALIDMNDKADACQALAKLGAEFPKMSPTLHAAEVSARKRAACR